jgi:HEAT repeat protein
VIALGAFRSEKAIQSLVQLSSDQSPELRGAAALAMAATHSKKNDFSEVLKEMTEDENPYVRERAARGLEIVQAKTPDVLLQLKSGDSDVRFTAALYFEGRGGGKELSALKDAWNTEADEDVRDQLSRSIITTKRRVQADKERRAKQAADAKAKKSEKAPKR